MNDIDNIQKIEDIIEVLKENIINKYLKEKETKKPKLSIDECFCKINNIMNNFDYSYIKADNERVKLKKDWLDKYNRNNEIILKYMKEFSNLKDLILTNNN